MKIENLFKNMNYIGKTKLSKITSVVLSLTTILWLSGVAMLVPVLTVSVSAATIVDGDVIKNPSASGVAQFDVYIVKLIGVKKFKRIVLNSQVFESYGHLSWSNVKSVDQTTMSSYTTSELVRTDGDTKVYKLVPDGDNGTKEWLNMTAEEFAVSYDWDSIYTVNSVDIGNYNVETINGTSGIMLDAETPVTGYIAAATYDNEFTKIKFSAGSTGYIVSSIGITRSGLSEDDDLLNVKLYDGNTQVGSSQSVNTLTHKATFSGLSWTVPANGFKVLTVRGSLNASCGSEPCADTGNIIKFGIAASGDIAVSSGTLPTATFPIYGNGLTVAGVTVGTLAVTASTSVSSRTLISGTNEQLVAGFNFSAASEAFTVNKIIISESGSAVSTDLKNIKLKVDNVQVGSTIASLTANEKAEFSGSLFSVASGTNKDVFVYADIADNITSARTVQFQIFEETDVTAIGANSGGVTLIKSTTNGAAFTTASSPSTASTINQGQLTVDFDTATNPSGGTVTVSGSSAVLIQTFKFSATVREGLNVNYLKLDLNTEETEDVEMTDYSNVLLYVGDSITPISTTGTIGSSSVSFGVSGSSDVLFNVPIGGNTVIKIKADISTTASSTYATDAAEERIGFYVSAKTNLTVRGALSGDKIPVDNMTITSVDAVGDSGAGTLSIKGYGTLTVANGPDTPAATTYTDGTSGFTVFKFRMTSSYEAMKVTTIKVRLWDASANTDEVAVDDTDFSNIKLYDGATLLDSVSLASGIATFNLTGFQVDMDTTKTLTVVLDVPTGSTLTNSLRLTEGFVTNWTGGAAITDAGELTTTGASSLQSVTETGNAISNAMTEGAPTFTIAASTSPALKSVVTGATAVWVGRMLVTANNENIKVTSVRVAAGDANVASTDESLASANWSQITIKVNGAAISGGGPKQLSNGGTSIVDYVLFDGLNFTVNKDQTATIDIYADAVGTATAWYFGITDSASQIQGAGIGSGISVAGGAAGSIYAGTAVTIVVSGGVTLSVNADTPVNQNVAVGTGGATGISFSNIKFEASNIENLVVKKVRLTLSGGAAADFVNVKLYDGATQIGATGYISGSTVDFIDDTNSLFTITKGTSKIITVKADLNGTTAGGDAVSGDGPRFYIASVTGTLDGTSGNNINLKIAGTDSSAAVTGTAGTPTPVTDTNFGAITLYKSVPTVSKNASSPSGAAVGGSNSEVLRVDVAADAKGDVIFNHVAFTVAGNADLDNEASGNAAIYKSTDLTTPVAYAPYITGAAVALGTTTATGVSTALDGIPVGSTIILDEAGVYSKVKLSTVTVSGTVATITWTPAVSTIAATNALTVYYVPMQAGASGKLFFGGQSALGADLASGGTTLTVASTDGFAIGDVLTVTGYSAAGVAITDDSVTVVDITSATAMTISGFLAAATIDYDYSWSAGDTADLAVAYVNTRLNNSNAATDAFIGETVAAGTTKTFIVKGDTTGADDGTGTETIQLSIGSIGDFNWDDTIRLGVTTLTSGLPLTGNSLTY